MPDLLHRAFTGAFGGNPALTVRAPGRVNLIGEHTDYNDGFVLPMAIDRAVWIALRPRTDGLVRVHALDFGQTASFDLDDVRRDADPSWQAYVKGVAWALAEEGQALSGWEGVLKGNVPLGAGLSSSAALELAAARAFAEVSDLAWNPAVMARIGQKAESEWVGMHCGIMDQLISAAGRADHALLIDCRSLGMSAFPLPPGSAVVVMDTGTRRGLVDSAYNERRVKCETAARFFDVPALRDVDRAIFEAGASGLDPVTRRRARHVITENERTLRAAETLRAGDAAGFGCLMNESHRSLRDDFEVSGPALDTMVAFAQARPECFGARMTGAGFGGCAVALVAEGHVDFFVGQVELAYEQATGTKPALFVCRATEGASRV